jgi:CPA2 family monovalent cation:H+ antiporter-2
MHASPLLQDLLVIIVVSLVVVALLRRIRVPAVVGFLVSGMLLGPGGFRLIGEAGKVETLAEIGVALLLFTIGLKFSLREMFRLRRWVFGAGLLQVGLTTAATFGLARAAGFGADMGLLLGFVLALSSTAIVLKLQEERGESHAPHGQLSLSILILQDLIVVPMLLLVPVLRERTGEWQGPALGLLKSLGLVVLLLVAARLVIPRLLEPVVRSRSPEVFTLAVIAIAMGTAYLSSQAGLSLALGAFLAGIVISESHYAHHVSAQILPLRDTLSSLFFVSVGMLVEPAGWLAGAGTLAALTVGVIGLKLIVVFVVALLFGLGLRNALLAGLALAQIGEFSFLLLHAAGGGTLLDEPTHQLLLSVSVLTMGLTPALMALAPLVARHTRRSAGASAAPAEVEELTDHVIIVGYGVNGRNVARALRKLAVSFVVIELNPQTTREIRDEGVAVIYGDACQQSILRHAGVERARVVVIAIADPLAAACITTVAHAMNPAARIIVRTRFVTEAEPLAQLGAQDVIPEEFETSLALLGRVMAAYGAPAMTIEREQTLMRRQGYRALQQPGGSDGNGPSLALLLSDADVAAVDLDEDSAAVGKTLRDLDLRARTGATVVSLVRGQQAVASPPADEVLRARDHVVLYGPPPALARAAELLRGS